MYRTRKHCFDVPGNNGVNEGIHIKHHDRNCEAVGVSFHRADVDVAPLDAQTLLFILRKILTAKAKGHRGQKALRTQEQWACGICRKNLVRSELVCILLTAKTLILVLRRSLQATHNT